MDGNTRAGIIEDSAGNRVRSPGPDGACRDAAAGGMQAWWTRVRRTPIVRGTGPSGPVSEVEPGHAGADGTPAPDGDGYRANG